MVPVAILNVDAINEFVFVRLAIGGRQSHTDVGTIDLDMIGCVWYCLLSGKKTGESVFLGKGSK